MIPSLENSMLKQSKRHPDSFSLLFVSLFQYTLALIQPGSYSTPASPSVVFEQRS